MQKLGFGVYILILFGNQVVFVEWVWLVDGIKFVKGVLLCYEEEVVLVDMGMVGKMVVQGKCCQVLVYFKLVVGLFGLLWVLLEFEVC